MWHSANHGFLVGVGKREQDKRDDLLQLAAVWKRVLLKAGELDFNAEIQESVVSLGVAKAEWPEIYFFAGAFVCGKQNSELPGKHESLSGHTLPVQQVWILCLSDENRGDFGREGDSVL